MKTHFRYWLLPVICCCLAVGARANEITEWNQILLQAANVPPATNPVILSRFAAIFQASVFDAVNGIERRFSPIYVEPKAPAGASRRAAAVQAAYAILVRLYPAQTATFDMRREISLGSIASDQAAENSQSIQRGVEWGQAVADEIWQSRVADGSSPTMTFEGDTEVGKWRPAPPSNAPGFGVQFRYVTPWVISSPGQFRPPAPPALTSEAYARDFNEVKLYGSATSTARTADQTLFAYFWHSTQGNYYWDQVANRLAEKEHLNFSDSNRLLAMVNIAIADATIGCWDAKYEYTTWRPITAIALAADDGNPATDPDSSWQPLVGTPPHPDYVSGHACQSAAAARILASYFRDDTPFRVTSNQMPGVVRNFNSFSEAVEEVNSARVYAGIHTRAACDQGTQLGYRVADYILENAFLPLAGNSSAVRTPR